jgi:glycosyltransferase involved in cell wall biosynthesis
MELKVAFLPVYRNPYQHLLTAELQSLGLRVEHLQAMPSAWWLLAERHRVPILHLHWLYGLYIRHVLTPIRLTAFLFRFFLARRLGYKIVWTVHNILPHRQLFPPVHRLVRRVVMTHADAVITHCEYGRREILRRFPSDVPVHVVPHGNYVGVHPVTMTKDQARNSLEIGDGCFVYALLGNISAYKGIENFVEVFQANAGQGDVALIAGRNRAPALTAHLESLAATDSRIRLFAGFVPDEEMQRYLLTADVAVFSFRQVLTSGSVILAMSYGLPVIAPALGCLPELVTPLAGLLYDPDDPTALGRALCAIKEKDTTEMGAEAQRTADSLRWADIARQTAAIYRDCMR